MAFITEWVQPAGSFTLPLPSGFTYNMVVDWGDGSPTSTVTSYNDVDATHTYAAGTFQISITGTCQAFKISYSSIRSRLRKVLDWGEVGFTGAGLQSAFYGCNNLNTLPAAGIPAGITTCQDMFNSCDVLPSSALNANLFANLNLTSSRAFSGTFSNCLALTTIPADLFRYNTAVSAYAFEKTFKGCLALTTIPADLFRYNTAVSTNGFEEIFASCWELINLPADLFRYNTAVTSFYQAFYNCSKLVSIPDDLFRYNTACLSFRETLYGCTKLIFKSNIFFQPGEESTRFLNKSVNFSSCFVRGSFTGSVKGYAPALWNCNFGSGTPTKSGCFSGAGISLTSLFNSCEIPTDWGRTTSCPKLWAFTSQRMSQTTLKLIAVSTAGTNAPDSLKCYFKLDDNTNLKTAPYEVSFTTSNNITFETTVNISDYKNWFAAVEYYTNGVLSETLLQNGLFLSVDQKPTTIINITDPNNYKILSNPAHDFNHGLIHYNGFIYGSARSNVIEPISSSLFKLKADNYSVLAQTIFYRNKNQQLNKIWNFDQIIECLGFLWVCQSIYLIRINPSDLDYMFFIMPEASDYSQPLCTDGENIYIGGNQNVFKLNANLLTDSFASYGYNGSDAVNLPANTFIGSCPVIQHSTNYLAHSHSMITDISFIYVAFTTSPTSGFDEIANMYYLHLQKINKNTMQTVGDVIIPKCTDDMVQNSTYLFLVPEYATSQQIGYLGYKWGLVAINKSTLEIKYLKALHTDYVAESPNNRRGYGVFLFGTKISVQLTDSFKTFIVDTTNVEQWGEDFPIGGATDAIYSYQINGSNLLAPPNELVLDSNDYIHINTWQNNTVVFKFSLSNFPGVEKTPAIQTVLNSVTGNSANISGFIVDEGKSAMTSGGFKYGTAPENLNINVPITPFSYNFNTILNSLEPGVYYVAAYGTNTQGTFYGNTVIVTILAPQFNSVALNHNNTIALLALLDSHSGHSIRCVQPAPGIATGTIGTATDQDGNVYDTIVINEKRWMIQNLKAKHFRNGDAIPNITVAAAWEADETGAWCVYDNKPSNE